MELYHETGLQCPLGPKNNSRFWRDDVLLLHVSLSTKTQISVAWPLIKLAWEEHVASKNLVQLDKQTKDIVLSFSISNR